MQRLVREIQNKFENPLRNINIGDLIETLNNSSFSCEFLYFMGLLSFPYHSYSYKYHLGACFTVFTFFNFVFYIMISFESYFL